MHSQKYPEEKSIHEQTQKAIALFHEIAQGAKEHNWKVAFLSGFAIDAHFGYMTKNHKDVDIMILKEQGAELAQYLTNLGHTVYEEENSKGECLKVDQADPEKPSRCHCDIHYFWEEEGKVVIPLRGKKLTFSESFSNITEELSFLDEKVLVLTPKYLAEEKNGWRDQIELPRSEEREKAYLEDMQKITYLGAE